VSLISDARTRLLSPENSTGEKGGGARWTPDLQNPNLPHSELAMDLGKGWKVRPFIRVLKGAVATLAYVNGPGVIQHIWMGTNAASYRQCILRFYWGDEDRMLIGINVNHMSYSQISPHGTPAGLDEECALSTSLSIDSSSFR